MKNKKGSLVLVATLAVLLAGCGNSNGQQSSNDHHEDHAKSEQVSKKKTQSSQVQSSIDDSTSSTQEIDNSSSNQSQEQSSATQKTAQNASVNQFSNQEQAKSYINNQGYQNSQQTNGLPTVNLGYNITGTIDSGAGQKYVHWNEGNWSFTVRASSIDGQNPVPTAQNIVSQLESVYLPAPENQGSGIFDIASGIYRLTWQKNNQVYTVTGSSPSDVIQKAVATK